MDFMDFLHASIDPGLPVQHPAQYGRFDGSRLFRFQNGAAPMAVVEGEQPTAAGLIPFRRATTFRTSRLQQTSGINVTAAEQQINVQLEGSGFVWGIDVEVDVETAGNAAVVAYHEDAPHNALSSVIFADVNGELVNLDGFSLRLAAMYGGWALENDNVATDTLVFEQVTGNVARGGSFHYHARVPIGVNQRTLLGILGNQDRAQKYSLRTNFNATGSIYTTGPTNAGAITIDRHYLNYAVPAPTNAQNVPQEIMPPKFGVLSYLTRMISPSPPVSSTTVNHFLSRLGNTIRVMILVFRDGNGATARGDAEANLPTSIRFLLGDTPIFSETAGLRRKLMWDKYGFNAPSGVFVYDFITDILRRAGDELGDDYIFSNGLVNAQFEITYPAGWAANSSLTIVTSDLQVPRGVDLYA
jgi:hypothetical protein